MAHLTGDPKRHDLSSFKESLSGSCLCGSITVTINDNELFTKPRGHLCHCANCRKVSGSVVSANLIMEEEKVDIKDRDGTLKVYEDKATNSGNPVYRYFCAVDGNPVMSKVDALPGKAIIKLGMMPVIPTPEMESFALHKHTWFKKPDGVKSYKILRTGELMDDE
ncbi:hypothetical protein KCU77_g16810, partial [Aureobasidium melanogenum]